MAHIQRIWWKFGIICENMNEFQKYSVCRVEYSQKHAKYEQKAPCAPIRKGMVACISRQPLARLSSNTIKDEFFNVSHTK